jgi:FAD/FMN-containing dehydrogenase
MADNKEMFRAVAGNFGCFGVIFDMTIQLVPEIIVKTENLYWVDDVF